MKKNVWYVFYDLINDELRCYMKTKNLSELWSSCKYTYLGILSEDLYHSVSFDSNDKTLDDDTFIKIGVL